MEVNLFPPPSTFAEGMRLLFAIAALVAGVAFGLGAVAIVAVLVWGGWPAVLYAKIVGILGVVAIGSLVLIAITQIGILLGGPVGRFSAKAGKQGVELSAEDHDALPPIVEAAAKGAAAGATEVPKP